MSASERWEYENPPYHSAETVKDIPCPNCESELQWQDEYNLHCPDCDKPWSAEWRSAQRMILYSSFGHPAARVFVENKEDEQ